MFTPEEYQQNLQAYQLYVAAYNGVLEERTRLIDALTKNREKENEYQTCLQDLGEKLKQYELMEAVKQRQMQDAAVD